MESGSRRCKIHIGYKIFSNFSFVGLEKKDLDQICLVCYLFLYNKYSNFECRKVERVIITLVTYHFFKYITFFLNVSIIETPLSNLVIAVNVSVVD